MMTNMFGAVGAKNSRPPTAEGMSKDEVMDRLSQGTGYKPIVHNPLIVHRTDSNPFLLSKLNWDDLGVQEFWSGVVKRDLDQEVSEIIKVPEIQKQNFLTNLEKKKTLIKDFLLTEIVPLDFAIDLALDEVTQEMNIIVGSEISTAFSEVREMMAQALYIKTLLFISKSLELQDDYVKMILDNMSEKKKFNMSDLMAKLKATQNHVPQVTHGKKAATT